MLLQPVSLPDSIFPSFASFFACLRERDQREREGSREVSATNIPTAN